MDNAQTVLSDNHRLIAEMRSIVVHMRRLGREMEETISKYRTDISDKPSETVLRPEKLPPPP
jgi:hypothetical protein